jgi:hypothetical protein
MAVVVFVVVVILMAGYTMSEKPRTPKTIVKCNKNVGLELNQCFYSY